MIIAQNLSTISHRVQLFCDYRSWLIDNIGQVSSIFEGFRPESIYHERFWSDSAKWSDLVSTYRELTADYDLCDNIVIEYGAGWSIIYSTCYDGENASIVKPQFKLFVIIDDDTFAVQFKLSVM
jgi:hypothetical protein